MLNQIEIKSIKHFLILIIFLLIIFTVYGSIEINKLSENIYRNSIVNIEMDQW